MADLITKDRAKLNPSLAGLTDDQLGALISAVSVLINRYYTIPNPTPADVEEACVQFMGYLTREPGLISDRLADWGKAYTAGTAAFPATVTMMLYDYKTPSTGPVVHEVDIS
jgi:hypothetical protein